MLQAFARAAGVRAGLPAGRPAELGAARQLVVAGAAMVVAAGWWVAIVELWPADSPPYIGGSQNNSVLELVLGYNGLGRLTGDETAASCPAAAARRRRHVGQTGIARHVRLVVRRPDRVAAPGRRWSCWSRPRPGAPRAPRTDRHSGRGRSSGAAGWSSPGSCSASAGHHPPVLHRGAGPGDRCARRHRRGRCCGAAAPARTPRGAWPRARSRTVLWIVRAARPQRDWMPWLRWRAARRRPDRDLGSASSGSRARTRRSPRRSSAARAGLAGPAPTRSRRSRPADRRDSAIAGPTVGRQLGCGRCPAARPAGSPVAANSRRCHRGQLAGAAALAPSACTGADGGPGGGRRRRRRRSARRARRATSSSALLGRRRLLHLGRRHDGANSAAGYQPTMATR